jgi:hypothetical protein
MIDFNYNANDPTGPRKSKFWSLRDSARRQPQTWRWPLQRVGDREPLVLARPGDFRHGAILGYETRADDGPLEVPVYAAQDGEVMFAGNTGEGYAISLDHRALGWATYYGRMSKIFVTRALFRHDRKRQWVNAGEVIGHVARSPIELRFALWKWVDTSGFVPADPLAQMALWIGALREAAPTTLDAAKAA